MTQASRPSEVVFRTLFEAEFPYVCRTLERFGIARRDVPDVAHDVFLVVHAHLAEYDPQRPLRPWLFAFAFRFAAKYRARHANSGVAEELSHEIPDEAPGPDEQLASAQARALVIEALRFIEENRRAVFILHELDEQPIPDVAMALGIPLNTAYSRLRLARDEFRSAVARLQRSQAHPRTTRQEAP